MERMLTGKKLRAIRTLKGMSRADLAERAGVSPVSIATYETGKSDPKASTLVKLCEALGVTVTYMVDGTTLSGP